MFFFYCDHSYIFLKNIFLIKGLNVFFLFIIILFKNVCCYLLLSYKLHRVKQSIIKHLIWRKFQFISQITLFRIMHYKINSSRTCIWNILTSKDIIHSTFEQVKSSCGSSAVLIKQVKYKKIHLRVSNFRKQIRTRKKNPKSFKVIVTVHTLVQCTEQSSVRPR